MEACYCNLHSGEAEIPADLTGINELWVCQPSCLKKKRKANIVARKAKNLSPTQRA